MKVLLVYPTAGPEQGFWPSLGLAYIGAYLEQAGHEVRLLDRLVASRERGSIDLVDEYSESVVRAFQPDLIGITATTLLIPDAFHAAGLAKRLVPEIPVVLGGVHASILPRETLDACPDIDIVVRGEGEETMKELCGGADPGSVAGIAYRKNGEVVATPDRGVIADLDELPFPARHLYDMKAYWDFPDGIIIGVEARATQIFNSRGCPYRCTYCSSNCVFGAKVRYVSPQRVVEEVEGILSDNPMTEGLYFCEDTFATNRKRALEICRLFIDHRLHRRIVWSAQLRANNVDEEVLRLMKKAGCVLVHYGFESASQRILDLMDKRVTVRQNYEAAALTRKTGLRFLAYIIVGMPSETREDFMATIEFLQAVQPDWICLFRFAPLPGSKLFDDLRRQGLIESDWSKYHYNLNNNRDVNFTAMTNEEFNELFNRYRRWSDETNIRRYISYNLARKPFRTFKNIPGLIANYANDPAVPDVARNLLQEPSRTLRHIPGRVVADPDVLTRKLSNLISRRP